MAKKILMGGICGMGMSPLAIFLGGESVQIEGFDDVPDCYVENLLKKAGITLKKRDDVDFENADEVILTSALKAEFNAIQKKSKTQILRRGQALAKLAKSRKLIGVCGSHGKTTTTTLMAHAILECNLDAGFITGAMPINFAPAKHCLAEKYLVAELDESDGTIENFFPEICVALNSDLDHTDTYKDSASLLQMFVRLFERTSKYIIIPENDKALIEATKQAKTKAEIIFVKVPENDFLEFDKAMASTALKVAFKDKFFEGSFLKFKGVRRRQEIIFEDEKIFVIADYAHHPNEVNSFLKYLDKRYSHHRLIFFQPHRYTRTKYFANAFKDVLENASKKGDKIYILPVYAASEPFDKNSCSKILQTENLMLAEFSEMKKIIEEFVENTEHQKVQNKICIAFIGAGNIYFKAKEIFEDEKF